MLSFSVRTVAALPSSSFTGSRSGMTTRGSLDGSRRRGADGPTIRGRAVRTGRLAGRDGVARPAKPRRWTLPITALRVTPPSCFAIWLAESPSAHSLRSSATRSSDQPMCSSPLGPWPRPFLTGMRHTPFLGEEVNGLWFCHVDTQDTVVIPWHMVGYSRLTNGLSAGTRLIKLSRDHDLAPQHG